MSSIFTDDGNDKPTPRKGRDPLPIPDSYYCLMRAKSKSKKV